MCWTATSSPQHNSIHTKDWAFFWGGVIVGGVFFSLWTVTAMKLGSGQHAFIHFSYCIKLRPGNHVHFHYKPQVKSALGHDGWEDDCVSIQRRERRWDGWELLRGAGESKILRNLFLISWIIAVLNQHGWGNSAKREVIHLSKDWQL